MHSSLAAPVMALPGAGHTRILIAPLFLAPSARLKRDAPELVARTPRRFLSVTIELLTPPGEIDVALDPTAGQLSGEIAR